MRKLNQRTGFLLSFLKESRIESNLFSAPATASAEAEITRYRTFALLKICEEARPKLGVSAKIVRCTNVHLERLR